MTDKITVKLGEILPVFKEATNYITKALKAEYSPLPSPLYQSLRITLTPLELVTRAAIHQALNGSNNTEKQQEIITNELVNLSTEIQDCISDIMGNTPHFIGGYAANLEKGLSKTSEPYLMAIPEVLERTKTINSSINVATTRQGLNLNAISIMADVLAKIGQNDINLPIPMEDDNFRNARSLILNKNPLAAVFPRTSNAAKLAIFANAPPDNPFMAGGYHGIQEPEIAINIGISGAGVITDAITTIMSTENARYDWEEISKRIRNHIAQMGNIAEKARLGTIEFMQEELQKRDLIRTYPIDKSAGICDLSIATTDDRSPDDGEPINSIGAALEALGIKPGGLGTLLGLNLIIDSVKRAGAFSIASPGGLSGTFIPVSEDAGMADAVSRRTLNYHSYLSMTAICSVGVDMLPVRWDRTEVDYKTFVRFLTGMIADTLVIGVVNNKTTSLRILPVDMSSMEKTQLGKDRIPWFWFKGGAGLLGASPAVKLDVNRVAPVARVPGDESDEGWTMKGRLPGPIHSHRD